MKSKYKVAILAILVIAGLEAFALAQGVDGVLFSAATAGVGAIVGYVFKGSTDKPN